MGELQRWGGASLQHHESEALTAVITKPRWGLGGLLCPCEESGSLCLSSGCPESFQLPSLALPPRTPAGVGHVVCAGESSLPSVILLVLSAQLGERWFREALSPTSQARPDTISKADGDWRGSAHPGLAVHHRGSCGANEHPGMHLLHMTYPVRTQQRCASSGLP